MAESATTTTASEKEHEAWGQPPPYNRGSLPPISAPPPATYAPPPPPVQAPYASTQQPPQHQPLQQQQQQQLQQQQQQQQVALPPQDSSQDSTRGNDASGPGSRKGWADSSAKVCASLQMVCGILMLIFQIVAIVIDANLHEAGYGIWGGLFMLITGILGIVAANKKSTSSIVGFMVLSIITAVLCLPVLILASIGLSQDIHKHRDYFWVAIFDYNSVSNKARAAMNGVMMIITLIEAIVAITSSALCCRAVCCGQNVHSPASNQVNVVYVGQTPYGGHYQQQVMFLAPHQMPRYQVVTHQMAHHQTYPAGGAMAVNHGQQPMMVHHSVPTSTVRT